MDIHVMTAATAMPLASQLVALLQNAVDHGASVGFLPPVSDSEAHFFWQQIIRELGTGNRALLVGTEEGKVVGSVQLVLATQPNAKHRAEVQKLFVHTDHRGKGYGRLLMDAVELEAARLKRTLLILDTKTGDVAEKLYETMGYHRVGSVPAYAMQADGTLGETTIFYKALAA